MSFIRPIQATDIDDYVALAYESKFGMTNLPKNPDALKKNIERSLRSFEGTTNELDALYLFVLEDPTIKTVIGVSGIISRTGVTRPLDYFKKKEIIPKKLFQEVPASYSILTRIQLHEEATEVCALYLSKKTRSEGYGKLLSFCRYLYMSQHLDRFNETTFADLRGIIHPDGECPFWDGVGRHFLPINFEELMRRRDLGHVEVADLMPHFSIYIDLLPEETREVIGKTHENTLPAFNMLLKQGFTATGEIDLFDAGPRMLAKTDQIHAIQKVKIMAVAKIEDNVKADRYITSTIGVPFKACLAKLLFTDKGLLIDRISANCLSAEPGTKLQVLR